MRPSPSVDGAPELASRWASRTLAASSIAIVLATTFPFEFFLHDTAARRATSFLFWLTLRTPDVADFLENILLFMPFGFGLACFLSRKSPHKGTVIFLCLLAGALLSFAVELSQVFLPTRDPSWNDVAANAIGALAGCVAFQLFGGTVLRCLSVLEAKMETLLTPRRAVAGFVLLVALGFGISVSLQETTSLGDWDSSYPLYIGNDPTGTRPWQGRVSELEFVSEVVSAGRGKQVAVSQARLSPANNPIAFYRLSIGAPFLDRNGASPELFWMPSIPPASRPDDTATTGPYWLGSHTPATRIAGDAKKTNRFTLSVICTPELTSAAPFGRIVSLSQDPQDLNFILSQEGSNLVFGLRTRLTGKQGEPALIATDVFADRDAKQITLTYDGSALLLYVNGKKDPHSLVLSPGAALLSHFFRLREADLRGYAVLYDFLLFVPLGLLLAFGARSKNPLGLSQRSLLLAGAVLPPSVLEAVLANVRRSNYHSHEAVLGVGVTLGSAALCNWNSRLPADLCSRADQGIVAETSFE